MFFYFVILSVWSCVLFCVMCVTVLCCVILHCSTLPPGIHLFADDDDDDDDDVVVDDDDDDDVVVDDDDDDNNNNNNNNNKEKRTGIPLALNSRVLLFRRTNRIFLSSLYKRSFTFRNQIISLAARDSSHSNRT